MSLPLHDGVCGLFLLTELLRRHHILWYVRVKVASNAHADDLSSYPQVIGLAIHTQPQDVPGLVQTGLWILPTS